MASKKREPEAAGPLDAGALDALVATVAGPEVFEAVFQWLRRQVVERGLQGELTRT